MDRVWAPSVVKPVFYQADDCCEASCPFVSASLYPCVLVCVSFVFHLLVVIPPALGLFAALTRGFGGGVHVEPGEGS